MKLSDIDTGGNVGNWVTAIPDEIGHFYHEDVTIHQNRRQFNK
jgi:hypothetical protein